VEFHGDLSTLAAKNLAEQVCHNIDLEVGNAANGWKLVEPVEVIVITGSLPFLPESFKDCLTQSGRIFAILGETDAMCATVIQRKGSHFSEKTVFETKVRRLLRAPEPLRFTF
jgi:protein-L-isoaspartate(D-aspartate) O-methyltransferase